MNINAEKLFFFTIHKESGKALSQIRPEFMAQQEDKIIS